MNEDDDVIIDTVANLEMYKEYCASVEDINTIPTFSEFISMMNE